MGWRWFAPQDKLSSLSFQEAGRKPVHFNPETFFWFCGFFFSLAFFFGVLPALPSFLSSPLSLGSVFLSLRFSHPLPIPLFPLLPQSFLSSSFSFCFCFSLFWVFSCMLSLLLSPPPLPWISLSPSPLSLLFLRSSCFVSSLSSISASLSFLELASVVSAGTLYQMHLALTPNWRLPWEFESSRSLSLGRNLPNPWLLLSPAWGHHIPELALLRAGWNNELGIPALTPLTFLAKSKSDRKPPAFCTGEVHPRLSSHDALFINNTTPLTYKELWISWKIGISFPKKFQLSYLNIQPSYLLRQKFQWGWAPAFNLNW